MMHKIQVFVMLLLIPLIGLFAYADHEGVSVKELLIPGDPVVQIDDIPIRVEIADTPASRKKGLSGRKTLPEASGMLFVFDEPGYHGIWMKDMHFPIDIIWADEDLRVVSVVRAAQPDTYPQIFEPSRPAKYVIETKVNFTKTFSITEGDTIELPINYQFKN